MEKKIINRIVVFNFILASFIILDLLLPGKENGIRELDSFYTFNASTGTSRKPIVDVKSIMELSDGKRYRIGKIPNKDYSKGQKVIIIKSALSNNVNDIKILDKNWEKISVGLFSNVAILILFMFSISITFLNIFIRNKILNISLIASMMFIAIICLIYNFYF